MGSTATLLFQLLPAGVKALHGMLGVLQRPASLGQRDMAGPRGLLDFRLVGDDRLLRSEDGSLHLLKLLLVAVAQFARLRRRRGRTLRRRPLTPFGFWILDFGFAGRV